MTPGGKGFFRGVGGWVGVSIKDRATITDTLYLVVRPTRMSMAGEIVQASLRSLKS